MTKKYIIVNGTESEYFICISKEDLDNKIEELKQACCNPEDWDIFELGERREFEIKTSVIFKD